MSHHNGKASFISHVRENAGMYHDEPSREAIRVGNVVLDQGKLPVEPRVIQFFRCLTGSFDHSGDYLLKSRVMARGDLRLYFRKNVARHCLELLIGDEVKLSSTSVGYACASKHVAGSIQRTTSEPVPGESIPLACNCGIPRVDVTTTVEKPYPYPGLSCSRSLSACNRRARLTVVFLSPDQALSDAVHVAPAGPMVLREVALSVTPC